MEAGCNSDKIEMYLLTLPFGIRISPLQHRRSKAYRGSLTSPVGALYSAAPVILLTKFSTCTCTCTAKFELVLTESQISFSNFLRYLRKFSTGTGRYWPVLLEISLEI